MVVDVAASLLVVLASVQVIDIGCLSFPLMTMLLALDLVP
jgi:hypothetical protein